MDILLCVKGVFLGRKKCNLFVFLNTRGYIDVTKGQKRKEGREIRVDSNFYKVDQEREIIVHSPSAKVGFYLKVIYV